MKRKLSRFSKTSVSLVLSFLMIVATVFVSPVGGETLDEEFSVFAGANQTGNDEIEVEKSEKQNSISNETKEQINDDVGEPKNITTLNNVTTTTRGDSISNFSDSKLNVIDNTVDVLSNKKLPNTSGASTGTFYYANSYNQSNIYTWTWKGNGSGSRTKLNLSNTYTNFYQMSYNTANIDSVIFTPNDGWDEGQTVTIPVTDAQKLDGRVFVPYKKMDSNSGKIGGYITTPTSYSSSLITNLNQVPAVESGKVRVYFTYDQSACTEWFKTLEQQGGSVYISYWGSTTDYTINSSSSVGIRMTKLTSGFDTSTYKSLYFADIPSDATGVIFNRGVWGGMSQTNDISFNGSSGNTVLKLHTENVDNTTQHLNQYSWSSLSTSSADSVTVYAKTGTVRDGRVEGTIDSGSYDTLGTYDKYSRLADITTFEYADTDADHKSISTTDERPYSTPASGVRVKKATVGRNRTIKISVTIKDGFRSKYYVKGFDVNGYTFGAIEQSEAENHKSSGTYTLTYTTSKYDDSNLEITPIYYYFINDKDQYLYNDSSNFITFSAEDFYGPVKDAWLGSIACFAYYTGIGSDNSQYTHFSRQITGYEVNDPVGYASLGGFPGQPMVYDGASYYMQLPKNLYAADGKTKIASIEGITMNNYIWDLVHSENIKGKTSDQAREGANYQTYDYDDFSALMERGATDIIFSFKYRNYLRGNQSPAANDGNRPFYKNGSGETEIMNPMDSAFVKTTIPSRNGWDVLVDYYDYPVDLFANRLENIDQDDIYIKTGDGENNRDKVLIVSDGYVNYYKTINENTEEYLGRYGTKWYVYKQDDSGNDFNYIGSMPPSAFLSDCIKDTYPGISTRPLTADDIDNDKFLSFAKSSFNSSLGNDSNFALLKTQYVTLYNSVVGLPAMITYESAITASKGLNYQFNEDGAGNNANRCDGRWYYSIPNSPIRANIIIQVVDDDGNIVELEDPTSESTPKGTKNRDTFNDGTHTGYNTNANAFFTNTTADVNGNSLKGQTDVTVIQNKDNRFSFSADPYSVTSTGKMYEFVGWYLNTGSDLYPPINYGVNANYVLGTRPMNSFATFVARYKEVEQEESPESTTDRKLKITHDLYYNSGSNDPIPHNGDGTPYVKVEILNSSDIVIKTYNNVYGGILVNGESGDDWLKDDYKVKVTLTTVTSTTDTYLHDIYREKVGEETSDYYRCGKSSGHNTDSTVTTDTVGTISELTSDTTTAPNTYSISYTYPVTTLFPGENNYGIVSRSFFTDLYTQGNIKVNFKYYDRDTTQHSKPTSISEGATTVTVLANPTITKDEVTTTSLENAVSNAVYGEYSTITVDGEEKSLNATVMSHLDNVVDNYYFWTNQDDAVDGIQLISCYRDTGIEMEYDLDAEGTPVYDAQDNTKLLYKTDAQGNPIMKIKLDQNGNRVYKSYKEVLGETVDYSYHTDAFGRLKGESVNSSTIGSAYGDSDKWVTYTMMGDSNVHTLTKNLTNVDLSLVDSITVWVYNAPKKYNVKVYTPTFDGNNAIQQTTTTGTNANVKTETINGTALTYYIPEDPVQKWAFYNQRLGDNDTYGPTSAAGSNNSIDYLTTYGITEAYAGGDIIAPNVPNMDFDGWYALKDSTGDSIDLDYKITSDKSFGYRISSNLAIIACYVPTPQETPTINNIPGVSVSNAGVDYYVDQSGETGTLKVRENTLLNVYYPGNFVDEDKGIKRYCAIIVKLPVVDTSGAEINWKTNDLEAMQTGLRAAIQDKLDNDIGDSGHYRENGSYDITKLSLTVEVNKKAGINCFTYDVKWDSEGSATSNQITLTNKNRVMFTFPMKASLYEGGSNAALLSYAAIYYDLTDTTNGDANSYNDGENTVNAKWILSDNYVPFIYGYE